MDGSNVKNFIKKKQNIPFCIVSAVESKINITLWDVSIIRSSLFFYAISLYRTRVFRRRGSYLSIDSVRKKHCDKPQLHREVIFLIKKAVVELRGNCTSRADGKFDCELMVFSSADRRSTSIVNLRSI